MIHLCQAEIEMIVLAVSVLNDPMAGMKLRLGRPPFSTKARHAIRGYMFQLIEEIQEHYGNFNGRKVKENLSH